jgi:uncharacterized protein with GYD domain
LAEEEGDLMPTYVLMTKLGTYDDPRGRRSAGADWKQKVRKVAPGVRWIKHYALLGPYDFMDIYEAPDAETAFRISMLSRELGAQVAESWPALDYESYLDVAADEVDQAARGKRSKTNGQRAREKTKQR